MLECCFVFSSTKCPVWACGEMMRLLARACAHLENENKPRTSGLIDVDACDMRRAVEMLRMERRSLRERVRDLEFSIAALTREEEADDWKRERAELLARVDELQVLATKAAADLETLHAEYRALDTAHSQLKAAVATAKCVEDLSWVEV